MEINEDSRVRKRRKEIEARKVKGITEAEYYVYIKKRGIKVE